MGNKIAVIGLGFVGLPLSLSFAMKGHSVIGLDVDASLIDELNEGKTHHLEEYQGRKIQEILKETRNSGTFKATTSYKLAFSEADSFIITVGLPVKDGEPLFTHFDSCMHDLGKGLKKGDTVLIRSTVVPGTTEKIAIPILEQESGLKAGVDFFIGYASERIAEGKAFDEFENMPTVVAGINAESCNKVTELLQKITKAQIHQASDIKIVETAKVFENVSRDVNIAMANQFAEFCQTIGIDTIETFNIANTHKRVNLLTPGPGVGGYCLPNAYYYLQPKLAELQIDLPLLSMSRMINDQIPARIVDILKAKIESKGKNLKDANIAVLGLAMKDYSNDDRISPAHDVCRLLVAREANVKAFDPAVQESYDYSVDTLNEAINGADAVITLTKQTAFDSLALIDIKDVMADQPIIIDTKHLWNREQAEKLNIDYFAI